MGMPYADQLAIKQRAIEELFAPFLPASVASSVAASSAATSPEGIVRPILGMTDPYHYRNKVTSPFAPGRRVASGSRANGGIAVKMGSKGKKGRAAAPQCEILTGMYAAHSHRLVPTDECLLENKQAKSAILAIRDIMLRFGMQPYDEDAHVGFLRHAVVRVGHESGEVLVTLVTNEREFPASRSFCRELVKRCPFITTVVQNVNTRQTNVILGEEEHVLYGPGFILDRLCGLSFRISSRSFYQVNATQTEVLYRAAIDLAGLTGRETIIDAYCGTGTIGLVAAKNGAARVIGVDSVASAIRDARQNARHNGVENAEFVAADAGDFMRERAAQMQGSDTNTVLFMDPPRAGSDEAFLGAACVLAPARIVYISCNPETQARDVAYLLRAGYEITAVQPVDMFPHTAHVESICLLTRVC